MTTISQPDALLACLQSLIDDLRAEADLRVMDADTRRYAAERIEYVLLVAEEGVAW